MVLTNYVISFIATVVMHVFIFSVINSQPKLKDLYNLITPEYAAHWKVIGTLLGIKQGILDGIEGAFPINMPWCCNKLLKTWLESDTNASWKKIIEVIDSPAMTSLKAANATTAVDSHQGNYLLVYNILL